MPTSQATVSSVGNAIANTEGFGASSTNKPTRTNNPGDIGNTDDGSTTTYATQEDGYNALYGQVGSMFDNTSSVYNSDMTIAQVGSHYASNSTAWSNSVASQLGVSPDTKLSDIASGAVPINVVAQPQGSGQVNDSGATSNGSAAPQVSNTGVDNTDPATAVPVFGQEISSEDVINATQPSLVISSGLSQAAWYNDPNILQVGGPTAGIEPPVQFQLFFKENGSPLPILIQLNASIRTYQKSMHHVFTKQQTQTGVLVNLWGMATDTISGAASTGLMANQLGVTDFLSLSTATSTIQQSVLQAFQSGDLVAADTIEAEMSSEGFFRIAAKDAFVELLSLFKNNGSVWFQNKNYTGVTSSMDQVGDDAWSPSTGSSTFQNAARRNDVMTRGKVVMYFRNAKYSGYFKSLSWVMDAKTPFRWNFNFVFQVESTTVTVEVPS
jgi:hypothetical protein